MSSNAHHSSQTPRTSIEVRDHVATLTFGYPERLNPLSLDAIEALQSALDALSQDTAVRVVILAAEGKAFCAGHDLREMRSTRDEAVHRALFDRCGRMMRTLTTMPKPVIARVQGLATAAGCQLVAACDLAVASTTARFAVSGINVGLFCSTPAVPLSRNLPRKRAMEMLLTGDFIDASVALDWGLVNQVVAPDALEEATRALAGKIAAKTPVSVQLGKQMFYRQLELPLAEAYAFASERMACNMNSDDAREGIDAFLEKRPPVWKGS